MKNKTTKQKIEIALKKDKRLLSSENDFNQTALIDLLEQYDAKILKILFDNPQFKKQFFVKAGDVYVFKLNDFKFFIEENKTDNSYTQYQNKIGLTSSNLFIKDSEDVVLNFPFKDCVLEGGQSFVKPTKN